MKVKPFSKTLKWLDFGLKFDKFTVKFWFSSILSFVFLYAGIGTSDSDIDVGSSADVDIDPDLGIRPSALWQRAFSLKKLE